MRRRNEGLGGDLRLILNFSIPFNTISLECVTKRREMYKKINEVSGVEKLSLGDTLPKWHRSYYRKQA